MKHIDAYQTSDGRIFTDERWAKVHQADVIGENLDALVANDTRGNVTRSDRFNILKNTLDDPGFVGKVKALYDSVFFGRYDDE
jgi:hypothetical protein